jgi:FKBP-type peptidyl-prolyl cis-trans isomerase (trigger factor)
MKISVKKIDVLRREMRFEVPEDRVSEKLNEVYQDLGKVAKVKGFRPGKVPRHVLEAEHAVLAREETVKKIIPEAYQEGLEQEDMSPLDLPEITNVDFKDGVIKFTAQFDIKPAIKIKNYKGITVKRKSSKVTEEEINKTLEYFKQSQGKDDKSTLDDDFVKGLGYPSLEEFKESLSRQMEIDKDRQNRLDVENQIIAALLKEARLVVPKSLVKKQLEYRLGEVKRMLKFILSLIKSRNWKALLLVRMRICLIKLWVSC